MSILKKSISLILVIVMVLGLVACAPNAKDTTGGTSQLSGTNESSGASGENKDEEKIMVVANSSEPVHYNGNAVVGAGGYPGANIFSSLFESSVTGEIIPDLATEYNISEDGLTYTFKLHDNVKWHDGTEFNSEDVKFTYETILKEKGVVVERISAIKEITCPDENTVVFSLSQKSVALLSVLPQIAILPKHLYEGTDWLNNPANQNPVGTGPFKFVEHKKGVSITLEAYDDYFLGRPEVDKIVYKTMPDENTVVQSYLNNEIDVIDLAAAVSPAAMPSLETAPNTKIETMISADRQYMVTNMQKEPWNDINVRKAVAMALDREEMVKKAHKGYAEVAEGFYTPAVSWAYTDKYKMPARDIEEAKKLLDEAGYSADANGVRIKDAEIVIFQFAVFSDIARIVQANLKEIGIETTITTLEYAAWDERLQEGKFDIAIIGGYHGPDPDGMRIRVGTGGILNYMKYSSPVIDGLLNEGNQETDIKKRAEIYDEFQKVLSEDLPVMPLTEWCYIVITRDNIDGHYVYLKDSVGSASYYKIDVK